MLYVAKKEFGTLKEALKEIYLSYSLKQSCLGMLMEGLTNFDSLGERVDEFNAEPDCMDPYVSLDGNVFRYETYSAVNTIEITEDVEGGKYLCKYEVQSDKPLQYSTAMNTFKEAGWKISSVDWTEEEEKEAVKEYEEELIRIMRNSSRIPGINFWVASKEYNGVTTITGHNISYDDGKVKKLLKNHPELGGEVRKIAHKQILEIKKIKCPKKYSYNEEMYESSFYQDEKEKVLSILRELVG